MRFTLSSSPAPAKRETSTLIPVKSEEMKTITMMKIWYETPMAAFAVKPIEMSDQDVVDDPLQPADDVREHRRPRELPHGRPERTLR